MRALIACLLALPWTSGTAHGLDSDGEWRMEAWLVAVLTAALLLYARGLVRLWRRSGVGRGVTPWNAAAFFSGWAFLLAALAPPIDPLGQRFFAMHMIQHEVLIIIAAPMLVLGRPLVAAAWGWPAAARHVHSAFDRGVLALAWRVLTAPLGAWLLHAAVLWAWHIPVLFEAALAYEGVHQFQHASFLASALFFWWPVLGGARGARSDAIALPYLFTTMLHTSVLGALLSLSARPWYSSYVQAAGAVAALADQQLGGLIMWVPAGAAYMAAAIWAGGRLLAGADRPTQAWR